jgi:hypothetical protein
MKLAYAALVAGLLISPAVSAQERASPTCDWDLRGVGTPRFGTCPKEKGETPAPVANVNREAEEHAHRTYERVLADGGCNADFIPTEIAAYCWNNAITRDANPNGPVGHSAGGSGDN